MKFCFAAAFIWKIKQISLVRNLQQRVVTDVCFERKIKMRDFMDLFSLKGKKRSSQAEPEDSALWHGKRTVQSWGGGCYLGTSEKVREETLMRLHGQPVWWFTE